MGATASSLTVEQKVVLTKRMKGAYDQLLADGLEDDIVKDSMFSEYHTIIKNMQAPDHTITEAIAAKVDHVKPEANKMSTSKTEPVLVKQLSRSSSTSVKNKKATKFSRRRSFDQANKHDAHKSQQILAAAAEVAAKLSATPEDVVDSWDSVTHQPFCTVCQMAFKSQDFLDRHMKFSDLHTKNVERSKKKDGKGDVPSEKINAPVPAAAAVTAEESRQVEGVHYKLFYTGSKFFWRTQMNIDVDIYLHLLPYVIEVISFDAIKGREDKRIYLNYYTIQSTLERLVSSDLEAAKLKEIAEQRFHGNADESVLREQLLLQRVITYILQRLQLDTTSSSGELTYVEEYGEGDLKSPLLDGPPITLVPVPLTRRRRTSAGEIESKFNSVLVDHTAIENALDMATTYEHATDSQEIEMPSLVASRIAAHVHAAAEYMAKKKSHHEASAPKRRFIQAARRVIRQTLVTKTREKLAARSKKAHESAAAAASGGGSGVSPKHHHQHKNSHDHAHHRPHEV